MGWSEGSKRADKRYGRGSIHLDGGVGEQMAQELRARDGMEEEEVIRYKSGNLRVGKASRRSGGELVGILGDHEPGVYSTQSGGWMVYSILCTVKVSVVLNNLQIGIDCSICNLRAIHSILKV